MGLLLCRLGFHKWEVIGHQLSALVLAEIPIPFDPACVIVGAPRKPRLQGVEDSGAGRLAV
jgi:hypothetical protein